MPAGRKAPAMAAGWCRPGLYLDATVRANISAFAFADESDVSRGVATLMRDLATGDWQRRFGQLIAICSMQGIG